MIAGSNLCPKYTLSHSTESATKHIGPIVTFDSITEFLTSAEKPILTLLPMTVC